MKTTLLRAAAVAVASCLGLGLMSAADAPVKREMRSAWVATVWRLDWPGSVISKSGDATQIKKQQDQMTTLLDSLYANNFNAINFQVRSRCDAMYRSSYEPWSSDLVSERGLNPGWDPLEWVTAECHKRGMECHAWLNPYRFESVTGQWSGLPGDYRKDHPDWVMDVKGASILNPGKPEVTQRICDIIREIVTNYDIDGVLFDDYFYLSGTTNDMDTDLYKIYTDGGGKLSQKDWRRDNVNRMVAGVYSTIKSAKPWVRFGVSPAGIACTSSSVASQYGIQPCPVGSDWQYNDIYSDPIAWISQQSLDFISPQIYWTIGSGTDYDKASKWWSEVAAKWDRHFYSSHSISSLTAASKMPGLSGAESDIHTMASGQNSTTFAEYANEVRLNRQYTLNDAPGSIFYSCKYLYSVAPLFAHYLRNSVFNTRALVPAITWQKSTNPGMVKNLSRNGAKLTWTGYDNVRYTVYAIPTSVPLQNFDREAQYLADVTYAPAYTIPSKYLSGYNFAVCVLDRYGNEYAAASPGVAAKDMPAPVPTVPAVGQAIEAPFSFEWKAVPNATEYVITIARDKAMTDIVATRSTQATSIESTLFPAFALRQTYYWTVTAGALNYNDGTSAAQAFSVVTLMVTDPAHASTGVSLTPTLTVSVPGRDVTLELSTDPDFEKAETTVYTAQGHTSFTIPRYTLAAGTTYHARLLYRAGNADMTSEVTSFTTKVIDPAVPAIAFPTDGGDFYADSHAQIAPIDGVKALRLEIASSESFPQRTSYIASTISTQTWTDTKAGADIKISSKNLVDGTKYYARVRGAYNNADGNTVNSDYSEPITFTYHTATSGVRAVTIPGVEITPEGIFSAKPVKVFTPAGMLVGTGRHITLPAGLYIVVDNEGNVAKLKF